MIDPKCISSNMDIKTINNSENGNTTVKKEQEDQEFDIKNNKLIEFIQKNHSYYGQSPLRFHLDTILPYTKQDPILIPHNFNIMLEGIKLGLDYIVECDSYGNCSFLDLNECTIHEVKPIACKNFPFTKDKCLRNDDIYVSICRGIKISEEEH